MDSCGGVDDGASRALAFDVAGLKTEVAKTLGLTDVGFALLPEHWRHGYAFEAARAVMEYGRSELAVDRIVGLTSKDNTASIRVLEKLGLAFERTITTSADDPSTVLYS